jgi:hypothetical protein
VTNNPSWESSGVEGKAGGGYLLGLDGSLGLTEEGLTWEQGAAPG